MRVQLKLMGMLKDKTPATGALELDEGATIEDVLAALDIPSDTVHVFSVNSNIERNKDRALNDDDELTILPPAGGG